MRILVTGGGTGGHVYPALAVLHETDAGTGVRWVGTQGGLEQPLVERAGIGYTGIAAGGIRGLAPRTVATNIVRLMRGFAQAWQELRGFRPDVVLATGGYVTFPVGVAAWLQRIPMVMYLPDIEPGLAVKALAPFATKVAVTAQPATTHFATKKTVVTGYPVRPELQLGTRTVSQARATFDIPADAFVLLVFGGSQGAHSLNQAVAKNLGGLLGCGHILHVHGKSDGEQLRSLRAALAPAQQARYHLYEYLHDEMADALIAADLVVARAGASTLGELPAAGTPAILVPYPHSGAHQWANAKFLVTKGAADAIDDADIAGQMLPAVQALATDRTRLDDMRAAMRRLAQPDAARRIYEVLATLTSENVPLHKRQNDGTLA